MSNNPQLQSYFSDTVKNTTNVRYIFHFWHPINILESDGVMFHINTRLLHPDTQEFGTGVFARLKLLRITTTYAPKIQNFSGGMTVSSFGGGEGVGYEMSGTSSKQHVQPVLHSADEKLEDILHTFGRFGVTASNVLTANNAAQDARNEAIFRVVTAGLTDKTLMEDMAEYFGGFASNALSNHPNPNWAMTAKDYVEQAATPQGLEIGDETIKLNSQEYTNALGLIDELLASLNAATARALDIQGGAGGGILPQAAIDYENKVIKAYSEIHSWLMKQFPSFPMNSDIEKSNNMVIRALNSGGGEQPQGISIEMYLEQQARNAEMFSEMKAMREEIATLKKAA